MMRTVYGIAMCLLSCYAFSQKNMFFGELGGVGGITSLNYERHWSSVPQLSFRVGVGMTLFGYSEDTPDETIPGCVLCGIDFGAPETVALTLPFSLQYMMALGNTNYLETGVGGSWQHTSGSKYPLYGIIGFRRYFADGKSWMWKVSFTPLLGVAGKNAVKDSEPTLWGGFSIGKRF